MRPMNSTNNIPVVIDDIGCWRRIGVWGSERPRCIELEKVVHCRNCAVFAQAAREVFERRLQTNVSASMPPVSAVPERDKGDAVCLPFRVGDLWLGMPASSIVAIADRTPLHSIPYRRDEVVKGLVPVNGEILVAISFLALLAHTPMSTPDLPGRLAYSRRVVVTARGRRVAFDVDEVRGVQRYFRAQLSEASRYFSPKLASFFEGTIDMDGGEKNKLGIVDIRAFLNALEKILV